MPGALAPFRPLARAVITLLLLGPALAFTCWLVLTCADFLGIIHFGRGLTRPWADFALRVGLGVLLPPALVAGLDERRPWLLRLREACRASLITFAAYAAGFFTVSSLLMHYASSMRVAMVPILLGQIGPLLMCALFYLSYRLVTLMLPQDVFLFATLVWLVGRRGLRVFRPVYVGVCILGPLLTVLEPGVYPLPWQIFHLLRTILSLAACVCLYTPPARRWLAA